MSEQADVLEALAEEIARHKTTAYLVGDDPSKEGVIRDGGYRCACGAVFGVLEFVPTGRRRGREPHPVGLTENQHLGEAVLEFLERYAR